MLLELQERQALLEKLALKVTLVPLVEQALQEPLALQEKQGLRALLAILVILALLVTWVRQEKLVQQEQQELQEQLERQAQQELQEQPERTVWCLVLPDPQGQLVPQALTQSCLGLQVLPDRLVLPERQGPQAQQDRQARKGQASQQLH